MTAKMVLLATISKKTLRFQANPVAVRSNSMKPVLFCFKSNPRHFMGKLSDNLSIYTVYVVMMEKKKLTLRPKK